VRRDGARPAGGTPAVRGLRRREGPSNGPLPSRRLGRRRLAAVVAPHV